MSLREIMKRAHEAQIKAGKCIPIQLSLFPPRLVVWEIVNEPPRVGDPNATSVRKVELDRKEIS